MIETVDVAILTFGFNDLKYVMRRRSLLLPYGFYSFCRDISLLWADSGEKEEE
jgi:hypothetical protein